MLSLDTKNTEKIKKQKNKRLYMCLQYDQGQPVREQNDGWQNV